MTTGWKAATAARRPHQRTPDSPGDGTDPRKSAQQGFDTFQKPGNGSNTILRGKFRRVEDRYQARRVNQLQFLNQSQGEMRR